VISAGSAPGLSNLVDFPIGSPATMFTASGSARHVLCPRRD
jgi:hypothetical protein